MKSPRIGGADLVSIPVWSRYGVLARLRAATLPLKVPKPGAGRARNPKQVAFARYGARDRLRNHQAGLNHKSKRNNKSLELGSCAHAYWVVVSIGQPPRP